MRYDLETALSRTGFAPVIDHSGDWYVFDLTDSYDPDFIQQKRWGIGRYNEKRSKMYVAPQYQGRRNIHMGIDFWTPVGEPVYAFFDGIIAYFADHRQQGNYGPTIITKHRIGGHQLFALYGHLSRDSLRGLNKEQPIKKGDRIGSVGSREENGGWMPHLHFQLSTEDPGQSDMPGVVAEEDRQEALKKFPDPRLVVGELY